jgi:glutaredoxin
MARMSDDMEIDTLEKYYAYRKMINSIYSEKKDKNMYTLLSHGGYSTLPYIIPNGVNIIMKCDEKMLVLTLEELNTLSRVFINEEACMDYLSLIATLSTYGFMNNFCVYGSGDVIGNMQLWGDNFPSDFKTQYGSTVKVDMSSRIFKLPVHCDLRYLPTTAPKPNIFLKGNTVLCNKPVAEWTDSTGTRQWLSDIVKNLLTLSPDGFTLVLLCCRDPLIPECAPLFNRPISVPLKRYYKNKYHGWEKMLRQRHIEGKPTDASRNANTMAFNFGSKNKKNWKIYTKEGCGFCKKAKELLSKRNMDFEEVDGLTSDGWKEKTPENFITWPKIFFKNKFIGGYSDLEKYLSKRK